MQLQVPAKRQIDLKYVALPNIFLNREHRLLERFLRKINLQPIPDFDIRPRQLLRFLPSFLPHALIFGTRVVP